MGQLEDHCAAASSSLLGVADDTKLRALYEQKRWSDVVDSARQLRSRSADANFEFGMALAHLQRWDEARAALASGHHLCPRQKRFPIELAGVAFQQRKYPAAARSIVRGLQLDPHDEYANDFAGTIFLLMGNLDAAVKYWNRVRKPDVNALKLDGNLHLQRLLLERAFAFSPLAMMRKHDLESSEARLAALGVFPAFAIKLDARPDGKFDAEFHAVERDGIGNGWLQSTAALLSGLPYETIYPTYFNLGRSATNLDSLLRWDAQKRRVWVSLSGPLRYLPQWRWQVAGDGRDENWAIRESFTRTATELGAFKLTLQTASGTVTSIRSGRFQWTSGAELSHRTYNNVTRGTALTASLVTPGFELKHLASVQTRVLDRPQRRLMLIATASSEFARLWTSPARLFEKAQGSAALHWLPEAEGERYEFVQRVRGGGIGGSPPFDELWMVGVERDNDLWLRGHIGTRNGKKGSAPMADRYFLSNSDFNRSVWSNGLVTIKAGPLLDVARAWAPKNALGSRKWLVDAGVEVKLSVLGTGVVLTYGRDLRSGNNAFYGLAGRR